MSVQSIPKALRAVVTADLVGSTERMSSQDRERFASLLREAYERLRDVLSNALPYPVAVFGGDSWQCYVHEPREALRVGLYLRAWAHATFDVDTRFALAIDTVDFVNERNVAESDGAAFRISGRMAGDLGERDRLLISVLLSPEEDEFRRLEETTSDLLLTAGDAVALLADRIASGWTRSQAQAISWRLLDPKCTQEEIGERWMPKPVSQQAVAKNLSRGGWDDVHVALLFFQRTVESAVQFADWLETTSPRWAR